MHIVGVNNSLTDIPSRSFGSDVAWHCEADTQLLTLFNATFPLPNQASWTIYHLSSEIAMRVISMPKKGKLIGTIGWPMSTLWEWTHTFAKPLTNTEFVPCLDLLPACDQEYMAEKSRYKLEWSLAQSRPLARQSLWPEE